MPSETNRYELGVLFVHGIGLNKKGDTLLQFGEPIVETLRRTLRASRQSPERPYAGGGVEFTRVRLHGSDTAPAHCEVLLHDVKTLRRDRTRHATKPDSAWLMAESCWNEEFPVPSYLDIVQWGFERLPASLIAHFDRSYRRARYALQLVWSPWRRLKAWGGVIASLVAMIIALAATPLLLVLLVVILLLAVAPVTRPLASFLQTLLAATIGDSYVLLGRPIASEAIFTKVNHDLEWLSERCDFVAIVAHSQGGAIAHETLRRHGTQKCDQLITFGSGLKKLAELQDGASGKARRAMLFSIAAVYSCPVLGWAAWAAGGSWAPLLGCASALAAILGIVSVSRWRDETGRSVDLNVQQQVDRRRFADRFRLPKSVVSWWDCHSSKDPVPNGPLLDDPTISQVRGFPFPRLFKTWNCGSALLDHTSYWKNVDDFTSRVVNSLLETAGLDLHKVDEDLSSRLQVSSVRRERRARWYGWAHIIWAVSAGLLFLRWPSQQAVYSEPVMRGVAEWLSRWSWALPVVYEEGTTNFTTSYPYGFSAVVALLFLGLCVTAWATWDWLETNRFFARRPYPPALRSGLWLSAAALVVLVFSTLFFVLDWSLLVSTLASVTAVAVAVIGEHAYWLPAGEVGQASEKLDRRATARVESEYLHGSPWAAFELGLRLNDRVEIWKEAAEWGSNEAAWSLGNHYSESGEEGAEELALAAYQQGVNREDGYCAYCKGTLLEQLGRIPEAEEAYEQSIALDYPPAAHTLGLVLHERYRAGGRRDEGLLTRSEQCYRRGTAMGDVLSMDFGGGLLAEQGDDDGAALSYRSALALGQSSSAIELGRLLDRRGDFQGALEAYGTGRRLRNPWAALEEGRLAKRLQDLTVAEAAYRAAIRDDWRRPDAEDTMNAPTGAIARDLLGRLYEQQGKLPLAAVAYRLSMEERCAEAAVDLGRLIEKHPEFAVYPPDLAQVLDARAAYKRGAELGSAEAAFLLARLNEKENGPSGAKDHFERAEKLGSADAAYWLAERALKDGKRAEALKAFDRAFQLGHPLALKRRVNLELGRPPD